jgi:hypothetical protein
MVEKNSYQQMLSTYSRRQTRGGMDTVIFTLIHEKIHILTLAPLQKKNQKCSNQEAKEQFSR